jgi:hypothetical protein
MHTVWHITYFISNCDFSLKNFDFMIVYLDKIGTYFGKQVVGLSKWNTQYNSQK